MTFKEDLEKSITLIHKQAPNFTPKVGIILGSGLGPLADKIEDPITISYKNLPGFPTSNVEGHEGSLVLGKLNGTPIACLKGRSHLYEEPQGIKLKMIIRALKCLGCEVLITANAVGSLRKEVAVGEIVAITDHINFQGTNPLVGPNDDEVGPRFINMENAYDSQLRKKLHEVAQEINVPLHDGVYLATLGPVFETPAEICAFKILGADTVGMSTVADVIVARHCGLKVLSVSAITNLASGLNPEPLSHDQTLRGAKLAEEKLCKLIIAFLTNY